MVERSLMHMFVSAGFGVNACPPVHRLQLWNWLSSTYRVTMAWTGILARISVNSGAVVRAGGNSHKSG